MILDYWRKLAQRNQLLRWGTLPGRYFFIADFFEAAYQVFPHYDENLWPDSLSLFVGGQMIVLLDKMILGRAGLPVFQDRLLDVSKRAVLQHDCESAYRELVHFFERDEFGHLSFLTLDELIVFGLELSQVIVNFWLPTLVIELANYGGWACLEEQIPKQDKSMLWIDLLALDQPTFYQQEEQHLLQHNNLEEHQKKYFWLQNSYFSTKVLDVDFFRKRKEKLTVTNTQHYFQSQAAKKLQLQQAFSLSDEAMRIADSLSFGLWLQEDRKQYILQLQHYKQLFFDAARFFCSYEKEAMYHFSLSELIALLQGESLLQRSSTFGLICSTERLSFVAEQESREYWQLLEDTMDTSAANSELRATVLVKGSKDIIEGRGYVFDPSVPATYEDNAIVVMRHMTNEHMIFLDRIQALIIENSQMISHSLLSAFAQMYCTHDADRRIAFIVIPGITSRIHTGDYLTVDTTTGVTKISHAAKLLGTVASKSMTREIHGEVLLWRATDNAQDVDYKDMVVVLPYLSLEVLNYLRAAACIVTDVGGLTSHGAIICREMGIPCIVNTRLATVKLRSGDRVSVDFERGEIVKASK